MNPTRHSPFLEHLETTIVRRFAAPVLEIGDLTRTSWDRQSDTVWAVFHLTAMHLEEARGNGRLLLVDARIERRLLRDALAGPLGLKHFFLKRWRRTKLNKLRRAVFFDTVSKTRCKASATDGAPNRGSGNTHVHMFLLLPNDMQESELIRELRYVFGHAKRMKNGKQFCIRRPMPDEAHGHVAMQDRPAATGAIGKLFYVIKGMGGAYNDLGLNKDRRRRKVPKRRAAANGRSTGIASASATNFFKNAAHFDQDTKRLAKSLFETWIADQKDVPSEDEQAQQLAA